MPVFVLMMSANIVLNKRTDFLNSFNISVLHRITFFKGKGICKGIYLKWSITGKITDAQNKQVLDGATVSVLDSASGIYVKHAVSNAKGEFTVSALPMDTALQVIVSFTGYRDTATTLRIDEKERTLNIDIWKLSVGDELEAVTVVGIKKVTSIHPDLRACR